ncbi:hypothetical protein GSY69_08595 [Brevibacterium sp. 5221]|uniref:Uncharacterized protein n=1 Tax=Brevibacterium rongguiense TaxID=2695267 RepID=A0A6N9H7T1_9MICO|nr:MULTISPECIES: DUF6350 family protein [Brevibacterium]MYM20019.1 hypothetical protein [Brevibacterium rongguiense]WAL40266.1 DUF6350 family protein [Brevibacterium sp. BRM-1]
METAPLTPARHPLVIAAGSAARFLAVLGGTALALAAAAWLAAAAAMLPLATIVTWAVAGIAAAFGLTVGVAGMALSLPPTLACLFVWWLLYRAGLRMRREFAAEDAAGEPSAAALRAQLGAGACLAAVALALAGAAVLFDPLVTGTVLGWVRACLLTVTAVGCGLGAPWARLVALCERRWGAPGGEAVRAGARLARRTALGLIVAAHLLLAAGMVAGWGDAMAVLRTYSSAPAAAVGLGLLQLLYAPTIWAGALSWASGSGIDLSAAAHASVLAGSDLPRPLVPVLALPPAAPPTWAPALVLVPVLVACACTVLRPRWLSEATWPALGAAALVFAAGLACAAPFLQGGVGPGGLTVFGVRAWPCAGILTGLVCAGLALGRSMGALRDRYDASAPAGAGPAAGAAEDAGADER